MKKAIPDRMPDWPEGEMPTTKQVELYLLFWEHHRKQLAPDPGVGFLQKSYWLDPEDLEINAYQAECLRAGRPDRAMFVRRLVATYHKRRTSRPTPIATPVEPRPAAKATCTGLVATVSQVLERSAAQTANSKRDLSPRRGERDFTDAGSWNLLATGKCLPHWSYCECEILLDTNRRAGQGIDEVRILVKRIQTPQQTLNQAGAPSSKWAKATASPTWTRTSVSDCSLAELVSNESMNQLLGRQWHVTST